MGVKVGMGVHVGRAVLVARAVALAVAVALEVAVAEAVLDALAVLVGRGVLVLRDVTVALGCSVGVGGVAVIAVPVAQGVLATLSSVFVTTVVAHGATLAVALGAGATRVGQSVGAAASASATGTAVTQATICGDEKTGSVYRPAAQLGWADCGLNDAESNKVATDTKMRSLRAGTVNFLRCITKSPDRLKK